MCILEEKALNSLLLIKVMALAESTMSRTMYRASQILKLLCIKSPTKATCRLSGCRYKAKFLIYPRLGSSTSSISECPCISQNIVTQMIYQTSYPGNGSLNLIWSGKREISTSVSWHAWRSRIIASLSMSCPINTSSLSRSPKCLSHLLSM